LWRIRLWQELPRRVLHLAAVAGLAASIRFAVAPPHQSPPASRLTPAGPADLQAQGFATSFARAYLTWSEDDPQARRQALEPFAGSALALEAGSEPPPHGSQRVTFEQVVQERKVQPHLTVYSIAVQTEPEGLVYLTVPVARASDGGLALGGYPAFVGPPPSTGAQALLEAGEEVQVQALRTMISRALRNYLAPAPSELAADLAPEARVSPPRQGLTFEALQSLTWALGGNEAVVAQVTATGPGNARYTLAYEVQVREIAGRWEIAAVQAGAGA
jgi:Conjugative transposon protein TcpC